MNPINNTDNELQKAIDDITKSAEQDKNAGTGAAQELEAKIQSGMGVPPVPGSGGLPPMPGAKAMNMGGVASFDDMAMPSTTGHVVSPDAATQGSVSMMGVQSGAAAAVANVGSAGSAGAGAVVAEAKGADGKGLGAVREAMMRDLFPLMDKVEMSAEQKYELYHEMLETTKDKEMVPAAYDAVKGIKDDKAKAEALLYLLEFTEK